MKTILLALTALASVPSAMANEVELLCNNGALVVTHLYNSEYGDNYVIQIGNKGVIDYFNNTANLFYNQINVDYAPGGSYALLNTGYRKDGGYEAVMYQIGLDRRVNYQLATYVKVTRRGAGALVETFLPRTGAGPNWYFENCR